jgi:hypothetical protein
MNNFSQVVAYKALNLLNERKALVYPDGTAFYLWQLPNRLVIVFDPDEIHIGKVNEDFAHTLSSRLAGRRVVRTNTRGVFLQVGQDVPPAPMDLTGRPLNVNEQPSPLHLPVGVTAHGDLWIDLVQADSILLTGSRGMGKTAILHGWIQALLNGEQAEVLGWDGKDGSEFGRYADRPQFKLVNLETSMRELLVETKRRRDVLTRSGCRNAAEYSQAVELMRPIALVIDEAALVPERTRPMLVEIVERCRDTGVHPIFGTNNPQQSSLVVKSNLVTRISLAVPALAASVMALGVSGAEKLPKMQGRGLIERDARMVEFQAFLVDCPMPSDEALRIVADSVETVKPDVGEIERLATSIREKWSPDMSKRKTAELLGKAYAGAWAAKTDQIIEFLGATTTTKPVLMTGFMPTGQ